MNSYKIYTRKTMGLDNRVWRFMFGIIILAVLLLSYRISDKKKCVSFSFEVRSLGMHSPDTFYTNEPISFVASVNSKDISWDFNDNSAGTGPSVTHQFLNEGIFLVTASSNSLCKAEKQITITNHPKAVVQQPDSIVNGKIYGVTSCKIFTEQKFAWSGVASSYEWSVPDHESLGTRTGQVATYVFKYPATYTIQVELDHDRTKRHTLEVVVLDDQKPKPIQIIQPGPILPYPPRPDTGKHTPVLPPIYADSTNGTHPHGPIKIGPLTLLDRLKEVISNGKTVQDFADYGIYGSTPVFINGKDHKTFAWLCSDISKTKKVGVFPFKKTVPATLETAVIHRENGIITGIDVEYKFK